jgi:hypothetical protein
MSASLTLSSGCRGATSRQEIVQPPDHDHPAKHLPGSIPFGLGARRMPAMWRSPMASAWGSVKLTVMVIGDAVGDAVLHHIQARGR